MSKHTSGPWVIEPEVVAGYVTGGYRIRGPKSKSHPAGRSVVLDSWYNVTMTDEDQLETSANARLIATAPDLLEACKAALEDIYNTLPDEGKLFLEGDARESVTLLEAAIKAAEEEGRA